jgi:hypothetical protein
LHFRPRENLTVALISGAGYVVNGTAYQEGQLQDFPAPDSHSRMGRPPLNVKSTNVRLGIDIRGRIDAVLRPGEKMAAFIRAAIERELAEREPKKPTKK